MRKIAFIVGVVIAMHNPAFAGDTEKENKEWVSYFYTEVLNKGNFDQIDDLVSKNYREHEPLPGFAPSREGLKQFFIAMRKSFPDLKNSVEFMVVEGDKVVSYITMTGTHKSEYMGAPGSGKTFEIKVIDIIRVVDGKMTEHWGVGDYLTMMEQLGLN